MSTVRTARDRVDVAYEVDVAVSGAAPRKRNYSDAMYQPDALHLSYRETGSGWTLARVQIRGRRLTKKGLGVGVSDSIWVSDLPAEEQWIRDAIADYQPRGSLR